MLVKNDLILSKLEKEKKELEKEASEVNHVLVKSLYEEKIIKIDDMIKFIEKDNIKNILKETIFLTNHILNNIALSVKDYEAFKETNLFSIREVAIYKASLKIIYIKKYGTFTETKKEFEEFYYLPICYLTASLKYNLKQLEKHGIYIQ